MNYTIENVAIMKCTRINEKGGFIKAQGDFLYPRGRCETRDLDKD